MLRVKTPIINPAFISHMVQMKLLFEVPIERIKLTLYPTWFR
ncbi:hypothetical protein THEYE_A2020 [Thermodesulfovibrio yellowstonii DSM 11347]|uniref:Uncharacterized protein n=1 Tax=Thermodesulfovibrio yellowstonii (strain ATCC 51303 / DSM 11347 / YP87) TaxID=289376 RepID=B5YIT3_THEYD|nr:hypothetical protein THEYE_A2020 [Thermodesulfovibrio yellowstonii DSM 11347]